MNAIFRRDFRAYFLTPVGYVFLAVFSLTAALFFYFGNIQYRLADLTGVYSALLFPIMLITLPVLTMRTLAEEFQYRRDTLLFTAPIPPRAVVLGKFWATLAVLGVGLGLTLSFPVTIACTGTLNLTQVIGCYIALVCVGAALLAIGLFLSSLTRNQVIAAVSTIGVFFGLYLLDVAAGLLGDSAAADVLRFLSPFGRFDSFAVGILNLADIVYYLTLTVVFLFLAARRLGKPRLAGKRSVLRETGLIAGVLAAAVLLNVGAGALGASTRIDLTSEGNYRLSEETEAILSSLDRPVNITVLASESAYQGDLPGTEEYGFTFNLGILHELLRRYEAASSGRLTVRYIDPDLNPQWMQELGQTQTVEYGDLLVETEMRSRVVSVWSLFSVEQNTFMTELLDTASYTLTSLRAEKQLTSAVLFVTSEVAPSSVILNGHNETYFGSLEQFLSLSNLPPRNINLQLEDLPFETELVVLAAPQADLTENEINKLSAYLSGGGNLWVLWHPALPSLPRLEALLAEWGLSVTPYYVFDDQSSYPPYKDYLLPYLADHTLNADLFGRGQNLILPECVAFAPLGESGADVEVASLLLSGDTAYGKDRTREITTDIPEETDTAGPFDLALLSARYGGEDDSMLGSIALLPASLVADDFISEPTYLNLRLVANLLNYVAPVSEQLMTQDLGIADKNLLQPVLSLTASQATVLFVVLVVLIPLAILAAGLVVFLRRRKL